MDEKKLMTHLIPGSDSEYFAFDAINSSRLKEATKSMKHFFEYEPKPATYAMKLGTALHEMVSGCFSDKYIWTDEKIDRRTKAGKEAWKKLEASGREIISEQSFDTIYWMSKALGQHTTMADVFFGEGIFEKEQGFWWTHQSGLKLKCKPDLLYKSPSGKISCFDLKTTRDASERGFLKAVSSFQYDIQAALYSLGLRERFGDQFERFYFVMVETEKPYGLGIYYLPDAYIQTVQDWIDRTLWEIHEIKAKDWPVYGYSNPKINKGVKEADIPVYLWYKYANL